MKNVLEKAIAHCRYLYSFLKDKKFIKQCALYLLFLIVAVSASVLTRSYIDSFTGYIVPDLILDNIPYVDMSFIFFQMSFLFLLSLIIVGLMYPKSAPFTLAASALFFLIRSAFLIFTHLSAPSTATYDYIQYEHHVREVLFSLRSGNDLFFSGHVGFPFLLALIFWNIRWLRVCFLASTAIAVVVVLVGHLHYSIDVLSAFFISFGIFEICKRLFKNEYELFLKN